ncbi:MAG: hypothetical protein ACW98A_00915 [Candidatus Hodarchaeales archaeon]
MTMKETDHPYISVTFTEDDITIVLGRPEEERIIEKVPWSSIRKIFYKSYDYGAPNYLFLSLDEFPLNKGMKYLVSITENGGKALWEEIKLRNLFDQGLAINTEASMNRIYSWP